MLTLLVKTTVSTNNNTLAKGSADTNTNTFVPILCTVFTFSSVHFFHGHLLVKLTEWLLSRNGKITIVYRDMTLMSKHCSSIYFRCKITVLAFTLSVTVMLLLTDLTSAPDDKSTGIKYCQKIRDKVSRIPYRYCIRKVSPAVCLQLLNTDTCGHACTDLLMNSDHKPIISQSDLVYWTYRSLSSHPASWAELLDHTDTQCLLCSALLALR